MPVILRQENEKWNLSAGSNFHEGEGEIPINYTISLTLNYRVLVIKMYWQQKVVINIRSSADTIFIRVLLRTQLTSYPISIFSLCCLCRYRQISFITCKTAIILLGSPSSLTILSRLSIKRKGKIVGITGILYIAWHTSPDNIIMVMSQIAIYTIFNWDLKTVLFALGRPVYGLSLIIILYHKLSFPD